MKKLFLIISAFVLCATARAQLSPVTAGALQSSAFGKAVDANMIVPVTFYVKSVAVLTAGAPADIATITIPSVITRYRILATTAGTTQCTIFVESQAGSTAVGTMALFDTAAGGGSQLLSTTAPPTTVGAIGWPAPGANVASVATTLFIRQMANSANAGTISFYITIFPIP